MREHTAGKLHYQEESDAYTHIVRAENDKIVVSFSLFSNSKAEADARHMVLCWNSHDELVTACKAALDRLDLIAEDNDIHSPHVTSLLRSVLADAQNLCRVCGEPLIHGKQHGHNANDQPFSNEDFFKLGIEGD